MSGEERYQVRDASYELNQVNVVAQDVWEVIDGLNEPSQVTAAGKDLRQVTDER